MMNPKIKEKWVKALRSGRYKQGRGRLKRGDKYCCLGVLCKIMRLKSRDNQILSENIVDKAGLDFPLGNPVKYKDETHSLTYLNDFVGLSFKEIADIIEEQL